MDPTAIATALAMRAATAAVSVAARRLEVLVLDTRERRALRRVIRESVMNAAAAHPSIAQISADIDLAGHEGVIDELFDASVPGRGMDWAHTREAWRKLYGGDAPANLIDLLNDAAADVRVRLQRSAVLRPLWSALTLERLGTQVSVMSERLDAVIDPAAAIRFRGPTLAASPAAAVEVASALAEQMKTAEPGNLLRLEAAGGDGSVKVHLEPGADLRIKFTKLVANTPEGRAELDRINQAMAAGEPIDMGDVTIETYLGGRAVQLFPEKGVLAAGPATRRLQVILTVASATAGIEERIALSCDGRRIGDKLHLDALSGNRGDVRASIRLDLPTRLATFTFYLADSDKPLRLVDQVTLHRILAAMAAGGVLEMYVVEFNLNSRTEFPPQLAFSESAAALPGLELLNTVARMLGQDLQSIDAFTHEDVAQLEWALQLLTTGEAPLKASGALILRGTEQTWRDIQAGAKPDGTVDFRYDAMSTIRLSQLALDLGKFVHSVRGARLPEAPTRDEDTFVIRLDLDEGIPVLVSRQITKEDSPVPGGATDDG
jgi:hypothetical protein